MNKQTSKFKQTEIGMIPEDWEIKRLKEVTLNIFSGGTPNTKTEEYWNGNLPWLSSGETRQTFIRDTERKITEEGVDNSSTRLAKKEDVVVAGAGQGHTRGQPSFCLIDTYINQSVVALRSNRKKITPYFLFYNLLSRYEELRQLSDAHSSRGSLTTKLLADLFIKLPPLEHQEIISKILSDLDFRIELNQQMNQTLEAIGQAIFKQWFVDFEFPDENGKPYKSSGGKMVFNEELGKEIPEGWEVGKLSNFVNVVKGVSYKSEELKESDKALVTLKSINRGGGLNKKGFKKYIGEYKKEQEIIDGDIVVAHTDITQKAEVLGKPAIVRVIKEYKALIASLDLSIVRPKNNSINNPYLYYLLKSDSFQNHTFGYSNGTTVLHLSSKAVPEYLFELPKKRLIFNFGENIKKLLNKKQKNEVEAENLSQIRNLLLPKLMSGKIRVPMEVTP